MRGKTTCVCGFCELCNALSKSRFFYTVKFSGSLVLESRADVIKNKMIN